MIVFPTNIVYSCLVDRLAVRALVIKENEGYKIAMEDIHSGKIVFWEWFFPQNAPNALKRAISKANSVI